MREDSDSISMTSEDLVQLLTRSDFLQELHHLLWLPPAQRRGHWDMGWNCRDHAFILGLVAALFGAESVLIQGRASFVQGPGRVRSGGLLNDLARISTTLS
jgi:hypothetical protein